MEKNEESLLCPERIKRKNHNSKSAYEKIATNIENFEQLAQFARSIKFKNIDKVVLSDNLTKNNGKFYKSCNNKFNELKLEREQRNSLLSSWMSKPEIVLKGGVENSQEIKARRILIKGLYNGKCQSIKMFILW